MFSRNDGGYEPGMGRKATLGQREKRVALTTLTSARKRIFNENRALKIKSRLLERRKV